MVELSLVASAGLPPAILHQEHQGLHRNPKFAAEIRFQLEFQVDISAVRRYSHKRDFQALLPLHGRKQDALRSSAVLFYKQHLEDFRQPMHVLMENNQSAWLPPIVEKPLLVDVQDSHPDSLQFSLGITAMCLRNEKIMKFLMSASKFAKGEDIDISLLSEVMVLHDVTIEMLLSRHVPVDDKLSVYEADIDDSQHPLLMHKQIYAPEPQFDFGGNLSDASYSTAPPDGRLLFAGNAAQMEDILSLVAELNSPKRSITGNKQSLLVPYFARKGRGRSQAHKQVAAPIVAPLTSSDAKLKTLPKKRKNKRIVREQDLYQRNSFHACENLLSVILDKRSCTAILSLKKSGTEINQLLTQFSAGIAGTGLAVIFSILCKRACGRAPFSATRLLSAGIGFGFVWLSWAINGLRDTISYVSKNTGKLNLKEDEIAIKLSSSVNEVLFRAATLAAVAVLRFA